ncbi:MAG TPA: hypothetical protein VHG08_21645 [Longimicrobium sp.]|nr:hypothetical protein [Longimicrobium sp.]
MKKLALNVDALRVESFEPGTPTAAEGTAHRDLPVAGLDLSLPLHLVSGYHLRVIAGSR